MLLTLVWLAVGLVRGADDVGAVAWVTWSAEERLAWIDEAQRDTRTLAATFRETVAHPLLERPVEQRGRLWLNSPGQLRWDIHEPEAVTYVLSHGRYTGFFPEDGYAETRDVGRWQARISRGLALGRPLDELGRFYRVTAPNPTADERERGEMRLSLAPRARRARRRVEAVELWFGLEDRLPRRILIVGGGGERREIHLADVRRNADVPPGTFDLELPEGVEVVDGFSWWVAPSEP